MRRGRKFSAGRLALKIDIIIKFDITTQNPFKTPIISLPGIMKREYPFEGYSF